MNIKDLAVGMSVRGGLFDLEYEVIKINKTNCWVQHNTGEKVMKGGRLIDLIFTYKNVDPSTLRK